MRNHTVCGKISGYLDSEGKHGRQVRKILSFEEEKSPRKKIAPSTPGYFHCAAPSVINVGDSDDEFDTNGIQTFNPDGQGDEKVCISMDHPLERTLDSKNPELCMRAVCALYRQQTDEEKRNKETLHYNGRGFSKFDAPRGSKLAEFLIDGDPSGDLKKSLLELQVYNSKGVKLCRKLATHYSKQLFQIYKNKEDPLFLPHDQASQ
ncbi:hypothetical protein OIU85_010434 [Salix viminalis]|uniref:Uncharacterized protein n=1 Tax=Salix viminalis TaxID=40686 RepID=A0A9Q0NWV4_SALVM|nr:hypothetical protein OIU85_010434 [Salix viminalis]